MNSKLVGMIGEQYAVDFLKDRGYKIIERNFKCKQGEIDIIMQDETELVFVEVKTRTNLKYGRPIESINNFKKKHIYLASKNFLYKYNLNRNFIRFDAIEIYLSYNKCIINHIKDIM